MPQHSPQEKGNTVLIKFAIALENVNGILKITYKNK